LWLRDRPHQADKYVHAAPAPVCSFPNGSGVAGGERVMVDRAHLKAEAFGRFHLGR